MEKRSVSQSNPTVANATSVQVLPANSARTFLEIENLTAGNIVIGLQGQTLTSIVPSASNPCTLLLAPVAGRSVWRSSETTCPTGAITVRQESGGSTNLIAIIEA